MRWRTALIVQELEKEIEAQGSQEELAQHQRIVRLLDEIDQCSDYINQLRTTRKRVQSEHEADDSSEIIARLHATREQLEAQLAPLLFSEGSSMNRYWGFMARAGFADKSHLMRQIEKYADIYTSRVSNLFQYTPRAHFRGHRQLLAHEPDLETCLPGKRPSRGICRVRVCLFVLLWALLNRNSQGLGLLFTSLEPRIAIAAQSANVKRRTERAEPRIAGSHPALPPPQALGNLGEDGASGRGSATALADKAAHDCAEEQREEGALQRHHVERHAEVEFGQLQQRSIRVDSMGSRAGLEDCMHEG